MKTREEIKQDLQDLANKLERYDEAYHQKDAPLVSDAEYDALRRRAEMLEAEYPDLIPANSLSRRVGFQPSTGFKKLTHAVPMLSLQDILPDVKRIIWMDSIEHIRD